ncbi:NMD3 family-domain-containing protein [Kalaharituber pfeilii]|nr:NMD3 family-domain-containing protein [Kalaharituber pfeilii]
MDIDVPVSMVGLVHPQASVANILCCNCGAPIDATTNNGLAICFDCIKLTTDISEGIPREATMHFCRGCERWLQPPSQWLAAQPESRELLALCLRKLKGLSKVRIIDASFIWTEPHSKRIKVKITVQSEAYQNTIIQQAFEVEYVVVYTQCSDCAKSFTAHTWRACVQVRQKVPHKRTFLYLEQLMLKHNAHRDATNIKEVKDGLDFFFSQRNHAQKMIDFLTAVAPVKTKKSEELISQDIHTSTKSFKFTFSVELVPICKDDLVCLPIKLARSIGNIPPLVLCQKVANTLHLLDPNTLHTAELAVPVYWRQPFPTLADVQDLVEFIVLDIEPLGPVQAKYVLAEVEVARASDMGRNDTTYLVRTHLGGILHPGDSAMGYHNTGANYNNPYFEELERTNPERIPEVILVKKHYRQKSKPKNRTWKLRRMAKEQGELLPKKAEIEHAERDYEMFLKDVEEDVELRNSLKLYKNTRKSNMQSVQKQQVEPRQEMEVDEDEESDDGIPKIQMEDLLDEFEEMALEDAATHQYEESAEL